MRVLHILSSDAFAGVERHVLRLLGDLRALRCDAELLCPTSATILRDRAVERGVPTHVRLRDAWRANPEIVHVHDGRAAVAAAFFATLAGTRLVRTQHFVRPASAERRGLLKFSSIALHRAVNRRLDGYIAVSVAAAAAAKDRNEIAGAPAAVISPGITVPDDATVRTAMAYRDALAMPVVCSVGRLEAERRFDVLVEAIPIVLRDSPDCRFVIAGVGSLAPALRRQVEQLNVASAVTWTGWLEDVAPVMQSSHMYVNTVPFEGFGMATAEAMAFALPVVATRSGASAELLEHEVSGYLVPPADPASLADAILQLIADPTRAAAMGSAARTRAVRDYSAAQTASATMAFYERIARSMRE